MEDGNIFEGEIDGETGLPEGRGTIQFSNRAKFEGQFKKGEMVFGRFNLPDKDAYFGEFASNV